MTGERLLSFRPGESFEAGLAGLAGWLAGQIANDRVEQAMTELTRRGLVA